MNFEQDPNSEIILRWLFMQQMLVVQYWGYDNLYLHYNGSIIWVNLRHLSYRDVAKMPIEEFDSGSYNLNKQSLADNINEEGALVSKMFDRSSISKHMA